MTHGSKVMTSVHSSRRHDPSDRAAAFIATISAWPSGSRNNSLWLFPKAIISPTLLSITAPTGTSPLAK